MPNACGFACVRALARMSVSVCICFSVHVGVCVSECMMLRPQADACGLFAFGMDASQNTDISSEMSSPIHVSHGALDKEAGSLGERRHFIGQKCSMGNKMRNKEGNRKHTKRIFSSEISITHRQTGRAVVRDAILTVGLPRVPCGRTPGAIGLLLCLLERHRE